MTGSIKTAPALANEAAHARFLNSRYVARMAGRKLQMRLVAKVVMGLLTLAGALPYATVQADNLPSVTVCDLAKDFKTYEGRSVLLRAVLITDRRHGASLIDRRCRGVYVDFTRQEPANASVTSLHELMYGDIFDLSLRVIEVKFVGVLSKEQFDARPGARRAIGTLLLTDVVSAVRHRGTVETATVPSE